ncbi:MAG: alkaline phosphatase family protein [Deltaproteobacteria bacterium]|nr:MAG: alkaline phosphatase family protein [Deltaproteobacteria bacterium]
MLLPSGGSHMRRFSLPLLACLAALLSAPPARAERVPRCRFGPGAMPAETLPGRPHGSAIPIDHIVVLMQENRSFDHYFGRLHDQGQPRVRPVPRNASNPDPTNASGPAIGTFHKTEYCETADLDHSWNGTHKEYDGGRMDGFTAQNVDPTDPTGQRTMGFYDRTDLPFYYALFSAFATSDRYFCSVLTQTFPNRFFLLAGTSFGHIANDLPTGDPVNDFAQPTIFNLLDTAGVSWKIYFSQIAFADEFSYVRNHVPSMTFPVQDFMTDAQNGTLPSVSFIDPIFLAQATVENDEHPPSNVQVGQNFVGGIINALFASPQWPSSALFLTWDEHGGFYDHLPPPAACVPDGIPPMLGSGDEPGAFDRYGIRVPVVVVSPFARQRYVSHRVYDHTSILRFIETRFDLPALTRRDANADPMLKLFNFKAATFALPVLPPAVIDQNQQAQCANAPPPSP